MIKDKDCTALTPLVLGHRDTPIYNKGIRIKPRIKGRFDTKHFQVIYLPELMPLEEYELIIVLLSGGKDSVACLLKLIELGVPREKIECWHHDIDGGNPDRMMDWPCTFNYCKALCEAENITFRPSYRVNGFFGELYRIGASEPVEWLDPNSGKVNQCKLSQNQLMSRKLKEQATEESEELLKQFGYRMKFPAKSGDLSRRWCSAYLKIAVADSVISNINSLNNKKILIVSGERRGESPGRSRYNEIEIHRTNAVKRKHRIVHQWRPVIDYTEKDVWEVLKRHKINPHPCYRLGWPRCSCAACIFSSPVLFAGFKELFPDAWQKLIQDEKLLGFTLDNKCDLETFIKGTVPRVNYDDAQALESIKTGIYSVENIYVKGEWNYPSGAFHGSDGGSC